MAPPGWLPGLHIMHLKCFQHFLILMKAAGNPIERLRIHALYTTCRGHQTGCMILHSPDSSYHMPCKIEYADNDLAAKVLLNP